MNGDREELGDAGDGALRLLGIEVHRAPQDPFGIQITQHQIGIGHRRLRTSEPIAGGTRVGAGTVGTDSDGPAFDARDGSAAGTDGLDSYHELAHGSTGDPLIGADLHLSVEHDADIGGGASHVECDDGLEPGGLGDTRRRGHAGSRSGQREAQRSLAHRRCGSHATGGVKQVHDGAVFGPLLETREMALGERHQGGVEKRGVRALVLAGLRVDAIRADDMGNNLRQALGETTLVLGIGVAVLECHGNRLDFERGHLVGHPITFLIGELTQHPALWADPFGNLEPPFFRY